MVVMMMQMITLVMKGNAICNDDSDGGICPDMLVVVVMIVAMMVIMAMCSGLKWSI